MSDQNSGQVFWSYTTLNPKFYEIYTDTPVHHTDTTNITNFYIYLCLLSLSKVESLVFMFFP